MRTSWPTPIPTTPMATASPAGRTGSGAPSTRQVVLGRFGWKAGEPTIDQQGSHAMAGDIGIANPLAPAAWGDCTAAQAACRAAPDGNSPQYDGLEASRQMMDQILFYARNLAVPARRGADDPTVLRGKQLFYQSGCTGCHRAEARDPARLGGRRRSPAS